MSSAMEIGKKMMEKWGWNKGQGLGKDKQGMTSCLVLKKQDGSSTQGRIEQAAPQVYSAKPKVSKSEPAPPGAPAAKDAKPEPENTAAAALCAAAMAGASPGLLAAMGAELGAARAKLLPEDPQEPAAKRQRTQASDAPVAGGAAAPAAAAAGLYDIDPRDAEAAGAAAAQQAAIAGGAVPEGMAEAAAVAAAALREHMAAMQQGVAGAGAAGGGAPDQLALALIPGMQPQAQQPAKQAEEPKEPVRFTLLGDGPVPADYRPPERKPRVRQYVRDDWRWSKGTEALWHFEEVQLAPTLLGLARKVLGEGSRYPARIADDTDCVTEVTAWGTLLVRPRGTGANMPLAKRMLFEVLHPMADDLREEVLITPDEMAEAALKNRNLISEGMEDADKVVEGIERSFHGKLKRVGLGAEEEALADTTKESKPSFIEVVLATSEDAALVKRHLEDLRIASGCTPVLNGVSLKLFGKERPVKKGKHFVNTLIETGEWVALTEGFVLSEETKVKRKGDEGPSEQILIKVPEGVVTQRIETYLKAMERAAQADQLKLTSKAVNGKRTLMVEGTKGAHERVKLMVKEISEKGESPMLTKAMGAARAQHKAEEEASALAELEGLAAEVSAEPGVISKPPVPAFQEKPAAAAREEAVGGPGLGSGPAMRHLPPPRLAAAQAAGEDLFAGLPPPDFPAGAAEAAAGDSHPGAIPKASFPPLPPGMAGAGGASGDLFSGLPEPATAPGLQAAAGGLAPAAAAATSLADATAAFIAAAAGVAPPEAAGDAMDGVTE